MSACSCQLEKRQLTLQLFLCSQAALYTRSACICFCFLPILCALVIGFFSFSFCFLQSPCLQFNYSAICIFSVKAHSKIHLKLYCAPEILAMRVIGQPLRLLHVYTPKWLLLMQLHDIPLPTLHLAYCSHLPQLMPLCSPLLVSYWVKTIFRPSKVNFTQFWCRTFQILCLPLIRASFFPARRPYANNLVLVLSITNGSQCIYRAIVVVGAERHWKWQEYASEPINEPGSRCVAWNAMRVLPYLRYFTFNLIIGLWVFCTEKTWNLILIGTEWSPMSLDFMGKFEVLDVHKLTFYDELESL